MISGSIATMTDRRLARADKEAGELVKRSAMLRCARSSLWSFHPAKSMALRAKGEVEMLCVWSFALSKSSRNFSSPQKRVFKVRFALALESRCNG
jgi:hypothetical protein